MELCRGLFRGSNGPQGGTDGPDEACIGVGYWRFEPRAFNRNKSRPRVTAEPQFMCHIAGPRTYALALV